MSFNYYFKCVAVGDAQARTTHLLHRYTAGELNAEYIPCFENHTTIVKDVNGHDVPIGLWDTAGQDDYDRLRQLSYQSAEVIILCFSLSHESSLENALSKYYPEMQACCPHVPFILVGVNSQPRDGCDMERSENPHPCVERSNLVAMEGRGVAAAAKLGASGYYYCCPSSGEGVDTVIRVAALCTQLAKKGGPPKSIFRRMRGIPKLILRALGLAPPKSPPRLSECIVDNGNVYTDTDTAAVSVSVAAEESAARPAQDIYLEEITDVLLLSSESELNLCNDDPGVA